MKGGKSVKERVCRAYNDYIRGENIDQMWVMFSLVSIFLPYIVSAIVIIVVTARALIKKETRNKIFSGLDIKLIAAFGVLNIATPLFFKNYLGFAACLGVLIILVYALYVRSVMTARFFTKSANVIAVMSLGCVIAARIQKIDPKFRSAAGFLNPNFYGAIITFVVLICFYRLLTCDKRKFFMTFTIIVNLYGLTLCDCQSAYFSIAFGVWLMLLLTTHYKSVIAITVLGIAGVCALPHLTFILPRIMDAGNNIALRAKIWRAGILSFMEYPLFGRGMLGYMQFYEKFGGPKNFHCHNLVIDMLASFGIIGNIPLVYFIVRNVKKAAKCRYVPLFFAIFGAVMLHGLTDITIVWIQTGALGAFMLSLAYIDKEREAKI